MSAAAQTEFGAAWADPARSASSLRAKASASGVRLRPAGAMDEADLAAAVVAAHAWALACGADSLAGARAVPAAERAGLAAVLVRAAGSAPVLSTPGEVLERWAQAELPAPSSQLLAGLAPALTWLARELEPPARVRALVAAADDLLGAGGPKCAPAGAALLAEAERLVEGHPRP